MATIFFLAPSHAGALLMAKYFEMFSNTKLSSVMQAPTENGYMISGEVDTEVYFTYALNAMQSLDRLIGHHFSFKVVDKQFEFYRITMM